MSEERCNEVSYSLMSEQFLFTVSKEEKQEMLAPLKYQLPSNKGLIIALNHKSATFKVWEAE